MHVRLRRFKLGRHLYRFDGIALSWETDPLRSVVRAVNVHGLEAAAARGLWAADE